MPHVTPLSINDAPEDSRPVLRAIEQKFGQSLNIFSTMAYQPDVLSGITKVNDGLQQDLPDRFRELAYYQASQVNSCDYCSHYHKQAAKKVGIRDEQLRAIEDGAANDEFDEEEKAVLAFAAQLTKTANVDREIVESLKSFLNDTQLVTLAATVALANFTNRFNHALGIELP